MSDWEDWEELEQFVSEAVKQRPVTIKCGDFELALTEGLPPNSLAAVLVALARSIHSHLRAQIDWDK